MKIDDLDFEQGKAVTSAVNILRNAKLKVAVCDGGSMRPTDTESILLVLKKV